MMDKPFTITLDAGSSRANKGPARGAPSGPSTSAAQRRAAAPVPPARTSRAGPDYEREWRTIMETNPLPAVIGRVC